MGGPVVDGRTYHSITNSTLLAQELIRNGAPADLELAEKVLNAVLFCQEPHPDDLHHGNFRWTYEEPQVKDLDAVQFVMLYLEPILLDHKEGELLHDRHIAEQSYREFIDWMKFTGRSGGAYEYNSATYTAVAIRVLSQLVGLVQDQETRMRAQVMLARAGLSAALHINPVTGRWIGPRDFHLLVW